MIELLPESKGNLIALKISGTVAENDDEDRYFEKAEIMLEKERVEYLLFDWEHLEGWAPGARSVGTWFGMHQRAMVGRVAIIADEKWAGDVLHRHLQGGHGAPVRAERTRGGVRLDQTVLKPGRRDDLGTYSTRVAPVGPRGW